MPIRYKQGKKRNRHVQVLAGESIWPVVEGMPESLLGVEGRDQVIACCGIEDWLIVLIHTIQWQRVRRLLDERPRGVGNEQNR